MSQNTGRTPQWIIGSMLGNAVSDGTRISSPALRCPNWICARWSRCTAAVHDDDSTQCGTPEPRRQLLLERPALRAQDVVPPLDDLQDAAVDDFAVMDARERDLGRHGVGWLRV